ncbi:MAG TPA: hypothetical protein VGP68_00740 [Gemmataceae bacterium]|nr:hypothetical protein [Gemmataceae bacterium]
MSEVRLVIREAERDWSGTIHGSHGDRAVAALSADPFTMEELEAATSRFAKRDPKRRFLANLDPGQNAEPYDAGLVVIDLIARLVVVDSTYSSPSHEGYVCYHNGECCTDEELRYHLADDWLFTSESTNWKTVAEERRRQRAAKPIRDVRLVFYGQPLLEFIGRECFAAFARRDEVAAEVRAEWAENARIRLAKEANISPDQVDASLLTEEKTAPKTWPGQERYASLFYETLKEIHAAWLLTPRDDLGGLCPREVALERRAHIGWDLQDRCQQWSIMRRGPRGLAETSHAFRYAGFGTHELVVYYDLVRELLWSCWGQLTELAQSSEGGQLPAALTIGDFLTAELPRLAKLRDAWMDEPNREFHGRSPRSIVARERARVPEVMSRQEEMHDPDCPCCQMLADMPGPAFWGLDGCNMDDEFAFEIYHRTREEWEEEQRSREKFNKKFNAEWAERKRLGVESSMPSEDGSNAIWSRSFTVNDAANVPLGVRIFGIGCHLAELIVGLRDGADREAVPVDTQRHIDQLNRDFGNLREILQNSDVSLAVALIDPVLDRFTETLDRVATDRPDLAKQCQSITDDLHKLLNPPSEDEGKEFPDEEVPF